MSSRVLRRKQVEHETGLSRSTIYARMSQGSFPKSIALGPRAVGWLESDIQTWIDQQVIMSGHSQGGAA